MGKRISKRHQLLTGHLEEKNKRNQKAFEKDEAFIHRKTNSNENKTNEENNVSNMEGNSSNTNEE